MTNALRHQNLDRNTVQLAEGDTSDVVETFNEFFSVVLTELRRVCLGEPSAFAAPASKLFARDLSLKLIRLGESAPPLPDMESAEI